MKRISYFVCSLLLVSLVACMPKFEIRVPTKEIAYSFDGGADLNQLFDFTVTYTDAQKQSVTETITLPWKKQLTVSLPFNAHMEVAFSRKQSIAEQEIYKVGFDGAIYEAAASTNYKSKYYSKIFGGGDSQTRECLAFGVELPDGLSPDDISLEIPPLKFNKHFAFSYTVDDSPTDAYSVVWSRIHGKWMDDNTRKFHVNSTRTTGSVPENTLAVTDGCGNERRFGFGVAIWPTWGNSYSPNGFITDEDAGSVYLSWLDLQRIVDFDNSVYYHNVNEQIYDKKSADAIVQGYEVDRLKTLAKLNRSMKVMALPDGNDTYITAAEQYQPIAFIRTSLARAGEYVKPHVYTSAADDWYKAQTYDGFEQATTRLNELEEQHLASDPYWVSYTTHVPNREVVELLETIYEKYGRYGSDDIWVASYDEIYEYHTLCREAEITKKVDGNMLRFEIAFPEHDNLYFKELSLLLKGVTEDCKVTPLTKNIVGLSHAPTTGSRELININFDSELQTRVEKYTARAEASYDDADKADARYFASRLLPELAAPYLARIDNIPGLSLTAIYLNDGAEQTSQAKVSVSVAMVGVPVDYRIGEQPDLSDATWTSWPSKAVSYTLSEGYGVKTVYMQVRNNSGESEIVSAQIRLRKELGADEVDAYEIESYLEKYDGYKASFNKQFKI